MPDRKSLHTPRLPRDRRRLVVNDSNRRVLVSEDILQIPETTLEGAGLSTSMGATDGLFDAVLDYLFARMGDELADHLGNVGEI